MQEPKLFLPKKGNYQELASYKKATVIYDLTFYFANRFLAKGDRTIDQMVQAARSGKQNIAEGCAAATTSAETELKLVNVARASMKELLVDYEDYLRVRNMSKWSYDDERIQMTREFCKTHESLDDFMHNIDKRSDEAIANITITLLHQFDNIIGAYIDRLQKDFVEEGGIRERMTAARLGYRNEQKNRITRLEEENARLKARIAELEQKLKGLGAMSLMGLIGLMRHIGLIGHIGLMRLMGLMGLICLVSCGGGGSDDLVASPTTVVNDELVPITFNGSQGAEAAETRAGGGTPLSEVATQFHVWGYKNMSYLAGSYGERQTVFPCYQVDWEANSAATTTTNTNNWDYIGDVSNQTIKFWDWSAKAYRFFAATEYDREAAVPATVAGYEANKAYGAYGAYEAYEAYEVSMLVSTEAVDEAPYFSRLWFSTGDAGTYPDKQFGRPVTLEFVKPYARVRYIYNYVYPREGITLEDQSFKPTDTGEKIYRKGVVTVTYPLEGTETKESYSMEPTYADDPEHLSAFTEDFDPDDDTKIYSTCDEGWYIVLPNTSQGSYTLTVSINGVEKTAVVPAAYMQWKPGYSYTYVFKITDAGGVEIGWVDYAVTPWTDVVADRAVYNW